MTIKSVNQRVARQGCIWRFVEQGRLVREKIFCLKDIGFFGNQANDLAVSVR
tara:strand:- start:1112 stop:1267 length:156 start_codon:yes stop_codon:yes gene_type:complete